MPDQMRAGGGGRATHAGAASLALLAAPLNVHILQALAKEPRGLMDLRQAIGLPPQSTMRVYSKALIDQGLITSHRRREFPGSTEYKITSVGRDLLSVGETLQAWLDAAPGSSLELGSNVAKSVVKALIDGWSANLVRAIAARPLCLTELDQLIANMSYPTLERKLSSMRLAGLAEVQPGAGRGTPYGATRWLRHAVVPLACATAWEHRHKHLRAAPIGRFEVEAAFLLAIPLVRVPEGFEGKCRLAVEIKGREKARLAGVRVCFEEGRVTSCSVRLDGEVSCSVCGSPQAWLGRLRGAADSSLQISRNMEQGKALLDAIAAIAAPSP